MTLKNDVMLDSKVQNYINDVLKNMPIGWLDTTTHRLDIYDEEHAKTEFLDQFENLFQANNSDPKALEALPTAYDYIRLGHPLSCVLEWTIGKLNGQPSEHVISFSSASVPILSILRTNLLNGKNTHLFHKGDLPKYFDAELIKNVYGYNFDLNMIQNEDQMSVSDGSNVFISKQDHIKKSKFDIGLDFSVNIYPNIGSVLIINGEENTSYISDIQHVRRRETIAMTPSNCLIALKSMIKPSSFEATVQNDKTNKSNVLEAIKSITGTNAMPLVGSSGLSVQYAIMMGLIDEALQKHKGKPIKFIVPPNCYGGTNDQARRVAACLDIVEIVDLPVDGDNEMVASIEKILSQIAKEDAVPYIIAEIPTNPRVEVPNLENLKAVLSKERQTSSGDIAIPPVFILDQTFCPNIHFLGEGEILSTVRTISYASGSKFPSGGRCTAGYCVVNTKTESIMEKIALHLALCDNEATSLQYQLLAEQLPSMNQRIADAYKNTHAFVNYIHDVLPNAKINFVSEDLAKQGFTPSVFSLDLPTKGANTEEKEANKRALNLKLINLMITKIPEESKFCVSYGQLKGVYWTIPATSTQGTTKEGDKDYIVRASLSPDMDLQRHKEVFSEFVDGL